MMVAAAANLVDIDGHRLSLSNLDKVLYPGRGFTKGKVVEYYARIAPVMLPHLRPHPLSLVRYPNGVEAPRFFQKNCPEHRPRWVRTMPLGNEGGTCLCTADSAAALVWLANLAALEIHPYLWTVEHPQRPSLLVFDFDPGPGMTIIDSCRVALRVREVLEKMGLASVPKTSGNKGLHLFVPLNTPVTFDQTKAFSRAVGQVIEEETPREVTTTMSKAVRPRKIFIDWSQNDRNKTTVSPYSMRGFDRPTVSTPLTWREVRAAVKSGDSESLVFEAPAVLKRVAKRGDVAKDLITLKQRLPDLR